MLWVAWSGNFSKVLAAFLSTLHLEFKLLRDNTNYYVMDDISLLLTIHIFFYFELIKVFSDNIEIRFIFSSDARILQS